MHPSYSPTPRINKIPLRPICGNKYLEEDGYCTFCHRNHLVEAKTQKVEVIRVKIPVRR